MVRIVEMDEDVTLKSQLEEVVGSVVLLNKFTVKLEAVDQFLKLFAATTEMFKQHLDLSPPSCTARLVVVVHSLIMLFESLQKHFKRAFNRPGGTD